MCPGGRKALTQHEEHLLKLPLPGGEVQLLWVEAKLLGSVGSTGQQLGQHRAPRPTREAEGWKAQGMSTHQPHKLKCKPTSLEISHGKSCRTRNCLPSHCRRTLYTVRTLHNTTTEPAQDAGEQGHGGPQGPHLCSAQPRPAPARMSPHSVVMSEGTARTTEDARGSESCQHWHFCFETLTR